MPAAKKVTKKVSRNLAVKKALRKKGSTSVSTGIKTPAKVSKRIKTDDVTKPPRKRGAPSMSIDFADGTDMKTAFEEVLKGGTTRGEVGQRLTDMWRENKTRTGKAKPVSTIINHVVRRARANGYEVEQTWRVVKKDADGNVIETATKLPPAKGVKKVALKAAKKAVKKPGVVKASKKVVKRRKAA